MQLGNSRTGYGLVAQSLHWVVAGLIVYQFVLAQRAEAATLFQQLGILGRHKSIGLTIFALAALRLAWNLASPRPDPPEDEPRYRLILARATHGALYALIFLLPVSGWIMSAAANIPVSYFGWFTLPNPVSPRQEWVEPLQAVHGALFATLTAIVIIHSAAALYHHFVLKDDVLRHMLPGLRRRKS
jgi:cytochrome b561